MKNMKISDELYDELKNWVVDPFDDTPEIVIKRALDIAGKARARWCALDAFANEEQGERTGARGTTATQDDLQFFPGESIEEHEDGQEMDSEQHNGDHEHSSHEAIKVL